ncbi:MAG: transposase [bacterium]
MKPDTHRGFYKHDNLPHFDDKGCLQFLTFVLADAAPRERRSHNSFQGRLDGERVFQTMDDQLDRCLGTCLLASAGAAIAFRDVLMETAEDHYSLLAWVVMPNHVHLLIRQLEHARLGDTVRLLKSRSSLRINRLLGRSGKLWQGSYFDRAMRSLDHLKHTLDYIHDNPVKAGLAACQTDWQHSSVHGFSLESLMDTVDPRRVLRKE